MDLAEAIRTRRSIGKVKSDPVPKTMIEQMLEAATWAPNHHHTEPWRFIVMTGDGRATLARGYAESAMEQLGERTASQREEIYDAQLKKAFRAPVVIAVAASLSPNPKAIETEELAAVHCAVQNMLLTAHALGLGAVWRTGEPAYHPAMRKAFRLQAGERLVGFVYVGYPDMTPSEPKRAPYAEKTTWLDQA